MSDNAATLRNDGSMKSTEKLMHEMHSEPLVAKSTKNVFDSCATTLSSRLASCGWSPRPCSNERRRRWLHAITSDTVMHTATTTVSAASATTTTTFKNGSNDVAVETTHDYATYNLTWHGMAWHGMTYVKPTTTTQRNRTLAQIMQSVSRSFVRSFVRRHQVVYYLLTYLLHCIYLLTCSSSFVCCVCASCFVFRGFVFRVSCFVFRVSCFVVRGSWFVFRVSWVWLVGRAAECLFASTNVVPADVSALGRITMDAERFFGPTDANSPFPELGNPPPFETP